ncbi:hypothetical protein [Butyrivibrio sp. WCD3002]|uniref:hypothetical protein n=1 Tax=Butyrivibrio sp. WCD3002 TaxID=1280676 RepID=UPI00040F5692|nr:hypothetical protein [Butyrivibrio sp. WCD3002]
MARVHFFEAIERDNNFPKEYIKLEKMCAEEYGSIYYHTHISINSWIEKNFRQWRRRSNYTSFTELRVQLGFSAKNYAIIASNIDLNQYLLFCEMLLNVIAGLREYKVDSLEKVIKALDETIKATIEKAGLEIREIDGDILIVEKNAVATEVAEKHAELAEIVIEYNHYLLKGDLKRKKELLKQLADALEPKRKVLSGLNKSQTDDFFYLVNNMNVRHNNCDPKDTFKYNKKFADLSQAEKESWYDLIYEQGLSLFVLLDQQERNKKIDAFKVG